MAAEGPEERTQIGTAGPPVSHISEAYPDRVEVRGRDLCGDLMGRLSFTDYFHLLLTGRELWPAPRSRGGAAGYGDGRLESRKESR